MSENELKHTIYYGYNDNEGNYRVDLTHIMEVYELKTETEAIALIDKQYKFKSHNLVHEKFTRYGPAIAEANQS